MTNLSELRLWEVRLQPLAGVDRAVAALLAAAWGGRRPLRALEARRCPLLGRKTVRRRRQRLRWCSALVAAEAGLRAASAAAAAPAARIAAAPRAAVV